MLMIQKDDLLQNNFFAIKLKLWYITWSWKHDLENKLKYDFFKYIYIKQFVNYFKINCKINEVGDLIRLHNALNWCSFRF